MASFGRTSPTARSRSSSGTFRSTVPPCSAAWMRWESSCPARHQAPPRLSPTRSRHSGGSGRCGAAGVASRSSKLQGGGRPIGSFSSPVRRSNCAPGLGWLSRSRGDTATNRRPASARRVVPRLPGSVRRLRQLLGESCPGECLDPHTFSVDSCATTPSQHGRPRRRHPQHPAATAPSGRRAPSASISHCAVASAMGR